MSEEQAIYTGETINIIAFPEMEMSEEQATYTTSGTSNITISPDPLQEYTRAYLNLQRFREANSLLCASLETLEGMVAEAEATLRADARELGPMRNEIIEVLVQYPTRRSYDGALLLKRAPWLETAGACKRVVMVDVDPKKVQALVKKGMLTEEALLGVITEKPLTPAVTIRPVGIRG